MSDWANAPRDSQAHARLLALEDRLPERDRLWLQARETRLDVPESIEQWRKLAERYPDYPPILMAAADPIIHFGPMYGIPIERARPYLERLEQLMPEHGDTRFHVAMVNMATGDAEASAKSLANASRVMGGPWAPVLGYMGRLYESEARGTPPPPRDSTLAVARGYAAEARRGQSWMRESGMFGIESGVIQGRLAALEQARAAGIYTGDLELASAYGEGLLRSARGDWAGGLRALRRIEESTFPYSERMTSARVAVLGAWVDAVDVAVADSAVRRVRAMRDDDATDVDRIELQWLDGVVGILLGDGPRVQRARQALHADTSATARLSLRSLSGLLLSRTNAEAGADSLLATSEDGMRSGGFLLSAEGLDRLIVARALRRRGAPARVERYLMWTDGSTYVPREYSAKFPLSPLVQYERGVALEEAGDREGAAYRLHRFLDSYDQPPAAHRGLVEDAKKRMAALSKTDAPAPRTVSPR